MNFTEAIPTFVITLREGVEAALVVGIVLACLKKADQTHLNSWVYAGIAAGIAASGFVGVLFNGLLAALSTSNQPYAPVIKQLLEGVLGIFAIAMLSWMLIWMTQQARFLKAEVEGALTAALKSNTNAGWGVFGLIFIAVLREGFETVIFISAQFQQGLTPALGAVGGLLGAAIIGSLIFKWGVKIDIRQFFKFMGILLLLIVAGLAVSALKHFDASAAILSQTDSQYAAICVFYDRTAQLHSCILGPMVWNVAGVLPDRQFPGVILKALFGYRDRIYLLQAVGYTIFLLTVGGLYFQKLTPQPTLPTKNTQPAPPQ
ncbi:MAG: FTR1 family iron permease [Microcoleus sp. PH2017_29_MFU_D_A]|uniref:FTR1 family iron permease n=1 Tax=unclassified Microcoleus TaxID=2642155 RepID=UPI001E0AA4A6|nr:MULTISPECIES: FTR1 family protein [unclassified Microcoleus]MCC3420755.1 FTR1 family iron permease [Microcoleus sp. PH2017_07_MST_O_A]MCC3432579.1 FTR1 family iron permease [Microcoleus sp. PH2017_04_SCI_O_A]MCC3442211.1 FTR1 family iron permease [Microcoleus sp. PH2017_03_ELD_O_A]MCC3467607.1 FTR1 family iron permease [Microcoleus sp. PH2017_06_SFM_O_A]MCC3503369.1 FTR1 family iron permease [Microcoleus sp. PH2017_19_SFW_U_A]MCC3508859.1 FTR1 family iron permease [Microcoleus sp. PH2017_1